MRHAIRSQRLSIPTDHRQALVKNLVKGLVVHGRIRTTFARAKEAQRLADRLVTWGKEGSVHSRRQAFRVLQDRTLVKQLFAEIAPRFADVSGGYTRVTRLAFRLGDGAALALLSLSRLPATQPAAAPGPKPVQPSGSPAGPKGPQPQKPEGAKKPKGLFEGLRSLWSRKQKRGSAAP